MRNESIYLKDRFPFLGEDGRNPILETYLRDNLDEEGWRDKKRPCLLICPGGAYHGISIREKEPIAIPFLSEGYQVFVLTYSVKPHSFPTQLLEVAAAMELIYENADAWHCDTDRIAIMGFSAGGHLAAHYSDCWNCPEVKAIFPDSKPVNASVLAYPVITADPQHAHKESICNLAGGAYPETPEKQAFYSCEKMVTKGTPPTFLWHTVEDRLVPVMNSLLYAQALTEKGVPYALHIYPYGRHGLATVDNETMGVLPPEATLAAHWIPAAKKWLKVTFSL